MIYVCLFDCLLVLEYLQRGTVMEVGKSGPIPEEKCHAYFVDMLLGVEYCEL